MPKRNTGPRLVLKQPARYPEPFYFIRWYEDGRKRERSTGTPDLATAERELETFLAGRARSRIPDGPRDPSEVTIAACLAIYGDKHAPTVADAARIGHCIDALLDFWGDRPVSFIKGETCRRYEARRGRAPGTVRRELGCLSAAVNYCVREGFLTHAPPVTLPAKPPPRERWLTRSEAAALLGAARAEPKARLHLPLFILIGLYTGARRSAILGLRWTPNTEGGWVDLERGRIDFNPVAHVQTNKRRARVPIPRRLMTFLRYARARATCDYVVSCEGRKVASVKRSFATALHGAGLDDVTPHTLRHTATTWLVQRGVPLWQVAGFVGASVETIERVYAHHAPDFLEGARTALDHATASPLRPRYERREAS